MASGVLRKAQNSMLKPQRGLSPPRQVVVLAATALLGYDCGMEKSRSSAELVCVLNLILALITAAAVYFGFMRQPAGRGEDMRQAVMRIWDDVLHAVAGDSPRSAGAVYGTGAAAGNGDERDTAAFSALLSEMAAKKRRESIEDDRFAGLLARLDADVRENRYAQARETAWEMETIAQQRDGEGGDSQYLSFARSVSRLLEIAGGQLPEARRELNTMERLGALREELGRLKAERDLYRENLRDARTEQRFAESALALQESNAQIQRLLLEALREQYEKSQEALSAVRAQLDAGEPLAIREARERTREGYREGIAEARGLLEQSLRIRNRDSRMAFLHEARTRYPSGSAMEKLIDTLLERL
jgi:hypothetical protein